MDAKTYQECALRTMASQVDILQRLYDGTGHGGQSKRNMQLINGIIGLTNEIGELSDALKRHVEYGKELDISNIKEEVGDCFWRLRQICDAVGLTFEECMQANIEKLKIRYPKEFSDIQAHEENRDREAERQVMVAESVAKRWAEKPEILEELEQRIKNETPVDWIDSTMTQNGQAMRPTPIVNKTVKIEKDGLCPICEGTGQVGGKDASFNSPPCPKCHPPEAKLPENWDKDPYTQNGQGWAEPAEDSPTQMMRDHEYGVQVHENLPPVVRVSMDSGKPEIVKSVLKKKPLSHSYTRYCRVCGLQPVHKTNQVGICTECYLRHGEPKETLDVNPSTTG